MNFISNRKQAFDEEGWYHTGDIGEEVSETIRIIGRKNGVYKTSQGEFISPEKLEAKLLNCTYLRQMYLHFDLKYSILVRIILSFSIYQNKFFLFKR